MWFIVKTDVFTEQSSMDFLKANYEETFVDFYFPLGRKISRNENGEEKVRFLPVLQGMFFIKVASKQRLERILSNHGYFAYKGVEYDTRTSEVVERTFFTKAHLLCSDSKEMALDDIIKQARIPDEDMDRFILARMTPSAYSAVR